ncbi:short-chain dehydrogenase [Frankia sp. CcI49]|uniref:SDR family NAD(P)-dependent oxidoreductase n=1 Tax=unclassified Frankia TaxID=2632575 RepID=UPI0006CA547E|nr:MULTISPECIES: SDR family oxidoreductase [unclassified Frankia]KPM55121.1 short-chain dehydrogenase [Frankia sp. R43]ONH56285.1 short-chain dehydrogenase [Frankia sp. CcI49]
MGARFTDKVVLVTGGGGALGRAAALSFAGEGATVAVAARTEGSAKETVSLIEANGGKASGVVVDVTRSESVKAMVDTVVARHGGLHVAFNNAGVLGGGTPVGDHDEDVWNQVLAVNLTGVFLAMKYETAYLAANGGGTIVNTASNLGAHWRLAGMSAYATSKAGVSFLTRTAALEYIGRGVRINSISPGPIDTPMSYLAGENREQRDARLSPTVPLGRVADPQEIANAVLWLASEESSYVVGHDHVIDGGATA